MSDSQPLRKSRNGTPMLYSEVVMGEPYGVELIGEAPTSVPTASEVDAVYEAIKTLKVALAAAGCTAASVRIVDEGPRKGT